MRLCDAKRIQQGNAILHHVRQRVGCTRRQANAGLDHSPDQIGCGRSIHALRQANIAIVIMNDAKALRHQPLNHIFRPRNHLRPKPHDEQDHWRIGRSAFFIIDIDIVRADGRHMSLPVALLYSANSQLQAIVIRCYDSNHIPFERRRRIHPAFFVSLQGWHCAPRGPCQNASATPFCATGQCPALHQAG